MALESLLIHGGVPLRGEVEISGAKNAVLPMMAAALLTPGRCTFRRVPDLVDVKTMVAILQSLGAKVQHAGDTLIIEAARIKDKADYDFVRKMRGSICVLGPLLGRLRKAKVSVPGGCQIGPRPIGLHLKGMEALGAKVRINGGYVRATGKEMRAGRVFLGGHAGPTVLGTANVMMAATLTKGTTVIESAACEPEITDLAILLNAMGARVEGAGSPTITVTGVKELHGAEHEVMPDRIEAATYAIAAVATKGEVTLKGARAEHLTAVLDKLVAAGAKIEQKRGRLTFKSGRTLKPVDITTLPYPGFPTDVQAQMMALLTQVPGISVVTERVFESRFMHAAELQRMGADVAVKGPSAIIKGGQTLSGAQVLASDLRASAALVIGGLVAGGITQVNRIYHLDRGYEKIDEKLSGLGARVQRIQN